MESPEESEERISPEIFIDAGSSKEALELLSRREFEIMELLLGNAGYVFDKEHIYESVWGLDAEGDSNVVKEHIRKIRMNLWEVTEKVWIH